MKLRPIRNHILFQFKEETDGTGFREKTSWGFQMPQNNDISTGRGRIGTVCSVGHECNKDIEPGMDVLIAPLKWTKGVSFEGETYWRTEDTHVLGVVEQ